MSESADSSDSSFVLFDLENDASSATVSVVAATRAMKDLRTRYTRLPAGFWSGVHAVVAGKLTEVATVPLPKLLAHAWGAYRPFREYADADKYPPDREVLVPVLKHAVHGTLKPTIEIEVQGKCVTAIHLEVQVTISIDSGALVIKGGRFRELRASSGTVTGTLKCEGATIADKTSDPVKLPGRISFGEGLPIRPWSTSGPAVDTDIRPLSAALPKAPSARADQQGASDLGA
jgi:hypothetical protein